MITPPVAMPINAMAEYTELGVHRLVAKGCREAQGHRHVDCGRASVDGASSQALVTSGARDEAGSPRRPHCRIVWRGRNRQTSHSIAGRSGAGEYQSVAPASDSPRDCRLPTRRMISATAMQSSSITPPMRRKLALVPKRSAIVPIIGGTTIDVNR
jgi:hypothetical protein